MDASFREVVEYYFDVSNYDEFHEALNFLWSRDFVVLDLTQFNIINDWLALGKPNRAVIKYGIGYTHLVFRGDHWSERRTQ